MRGERDHPGQRTAGLDQDTAGLDQDTAGLDQDTAGSTRIWQARLSYVPLAGLDRVRHSHWKVRVQQPHNQP